MEIESFQSYRSYLQSNEQNETCQSAYDRSEISQNEQNENGQSCESQVGYSLQGKEQLDFFQNLNQHQNNNFQTEQTKKNQIFDVNCYQPDMYQISNQSNIQSSYEQALEYRRDTFSNVSDLITNPDKSKLQEILLYANKEQVNKIDDQKNKNKIVLGDEIINRYQNSLICNPLQQFYFISGNICVMNCALNKEFTHFSNLNQYKIPIKTKACSTLGTLEVDLNNKRGGIQNFDFIIQKMRSFSNQKIYKFSLVLEKYQKFVNSYLQRQELLKYQQVTNQFLTKIDSKFDQFVLNTQKIILEIAQNHPFFSYTLNQFNLHNFEMEMRKFGYSEAFLALLGVDMKQAQSFIWRKGLFDYMDKKNIQEMAFQYISHIIGDDLIQPHDITLCTFDGYEVYAINNIRVFIDRDTENQFLGINQALFVNVYDVSPNMIKQIITIRAKNKESSLEKIKQQEEDLSYSMEANIFLEKYYKNQQENFLLQNKRAGYQLIQ
ncbi:hypothetical protein ABPG72_018205 [Tetrahymena utriculariae]